ncbi:hypothetical protein PVL29_020947 [Vitis rotundifolia]|uniref:VOC domain-containing protein n=1 Tax=Vitis rotundifolia TaxID=103349 RepID=A0AA38YYS8_VITRO|nr:hypothetical protein PVL29_020947 [Vitis rotundifolia]
MISHLKEVPEYKYERETSVYYGVDKYDIGTGFGHFAIGTQDVYKMVEDIRAKGGIITREPGPFKGGKSVIAFLIQRSLTPEPLCQVMLRVGDLERSIKFYEKALGMKMVKKTDTPEYKIQGFETKRRIPGFAGKPYGGEFVPGPQKTKGKPFAHIKELHNGMV